MKVLTKQPAAQGARPDAAAPHAPRTSTEAPTADPVAAARVAAAAGASGVPVWRQLAAPQQHQAILALQRTVGNAFVRRWLAGDGARAGSGDCEGRTTTEPGRPVAGGAAGAPRPAPGQPVSMPAIQCVSFGTDGELSAAHQATVQAAAGIAERLVLGQPFRAKWTAFWAGPGVGISPKPTLVEYQEAVQLRVIHDMDSTTAPNVAAFVTSEGGPVERQTAAVTRVGTRETYLRRFHIAQGVDAVTSTLMHESLHGAGLDEGPIGMWEPFFHQFEADIGFPMMMGGADIGEIGQAPSGATGVDVTFTYALRKVGSENLPTQLEIQVVDAQSGDVVSDAQPDGTRRPASQIVPSTVGLGTWIWHARKPDLSAYTVRVRDLTAPMMLGSKQFTITPRAGGGGAETTDAKVITPGAFLAEVDAGALVEGSRVVAWDFVGRATSFAAAMGLRGGSGVGHGWVIVERPLGAFHVYKTNLVSEKNLQVTGIDDGDSEGGLLASPKRFQHAWLILCAELACRAAPLQVY